MMDSMRSLNKSLPASTSKSRSTQPPEQLLQAFKAAALSVTNLYKISVSQEAAQEASVKRQGYQDALDHLLTFLDKENIGLDDGEGWKIRQWATERLDVIPTANQASESEDERGENEKRIDEPSPELINQSLPEQANPHVEGTSSPPSTRNENPRHESNDRHFQVPSHHASIFPPKLETFTFRSSHPYPSEIEMQSYDHSADSNMSPEANISNRPVTPSHVRVEVVARGSRSSTRHNNHSNRHSARLAASARSTGVLTGSKRRIPFGEFFDISGLTENRDGIGSKKSRTT